MKLDRPSTHLLDVEISVGGITQPSLDLAMPAWAPGRYAIYDFAKNVQEFSARGAQGQELVWDKIDKQTWRVDTSKAGGTLKVRYRVFANDLSGSFSQFDTSHAIVNGASVFLYVAGHKPDSLTLDVNAPPHWQVISGFSSSTAQRNFQVPNYDRLVDTPLEISPECKLEEFQEQGKIFRVAVHSYDTDDDARAKLVAGLKKIVHTEMAGMPSPDFSEYTFFFHFAPDIAMGDGMEHLNSTDIIVRGGLETAVPEALETAAHEFFHLWNVKRLRPAALGPFDYTRENYTRSLWFAEGVTTYCSYLALLRSGLWTREQFLKRLGEEIRALEQEPGRSLMSAESSSFNAWFYDRSPQMQETNFANGTISYYNKGALLGMLLDLEIRAQTQGRKSLRDAFVEMYHKFYESPPTSYYGPGRGYHEADILMAVNAVTGSDFASFFERYVRGMEPLPYAETLKLAGMEFRTSVAAGTAPDLGALVRPEDMGARIVAVRPGGPADRAGLSRDDLLISVDDQSLATEELQDRLKIYPPGAKVPFAIARHGQREIVMVTLDPPPPNVYSIQELAGATPEQIAAREAWLGSK
ncbi:MAG: PDZ domain-containing protein [Acidobacteriia bacterium]|nr:PDZ domain-containing protein [Terriglobia bacterium]